MYKKPLGLSEWDKVRDPQGKVSIAYAAFDLVEKYHDPQGIQDLIDEKGIHDMISHINDFYWKTHGRNALVLIQRTDGISTLYCSNEFPDQDNRIEFVHIDPSKI